MRLFFKFQKLICFLFCISPLLNPLFAQGPIELHQDDTAGVLHVIIEGHEAFIYRYTRWLDIPHIWPLYSPSGKNMLVQQTEPYPHHRSFYVADTIKLTGEREVSTYYALRSGQSIGMNSYGPPYRDHICHDKFTSLEAESNRAVIGIILIWEMDGDKRVLEEQRQISIHSLGKGEYLIDMRFELIAAYGDVEFVSDDVHYAWPFVRMHPRFSGESGGTITADNNAMGEKATNMKTALWIDYSNTVEGVTEGLAVFQFPDGKEHRWLTREYGIFGPRRPDEKSGKPFMLEKGKSITQRVGILVHKGDVKTGRVGKRYKQYTQGKWK
ncbi:MAG: PmoA family protein [Candidatus Aminicenantes bacterium]|nr:MAG: PmoA family protein [Candidatus Aminicenantes bacterium]